MMVLYFFRGFSFILISCSLVLCSTGFYNTTSDVTQAATTKWLWPWHPDIHWYHEYLNLSSARPEIWDGLHLGMLTGLRKLNFSHVTFKWVAQVLPNYTALDEVYKKEYEGTGRNMFVCFPQFVGKFPDWFDLDEVWLCVNYTPLLTSILRNKEWGYLYDTNKPFVDIGIGIGTVVMVVGIPGKLLSLHFTQSRLLLSVYLLD